MKCSIIKTVGILLLTVSMSASPAWALPWFSKMYVFGDSTTDTGNDFYASGGIIPPQTRYYNGRFSNGNVWVDSLAQSMGINLKFSLDPSLNLSAGDSANFAFGGATTGYQNLTPDGVATVPGLRGQVNLFNLAVGGSADPNALNVIWSGDTDYDYGLYLPHDPATIVGNIKAALQDLYNAGARNFLVANLPDLGQIPINQLLAGWLNDPTIATTLTNESVAHNALLKQALYELIQDNADMVIYELDNFTLVKQVMADPAAFGFVSTGPGPASGCLVPISPTFTTNCLPLPGGFNADGYVFWDEQHPTTMAHLLLAEAARNTNALIPEPMTAGLLLIGLGGLSLVRCNQRTGRRLLLRCCSLPTDLP